MPKNASTDRHYTGVNVLILWGAVIECGFTGQSWLTFRQALSFGGHVRKSERGTTVVYADRFVPSDEKQRATETGEEAQTISFLKRFTVYVTPHQLRHTFAVHMLAMLIQHRLRDAALPAGSMEGYRQFLGDPLQQVQRLLGHASLATTYIYLDHVASRADTVDAAVEELLALLPSEHSL